MSTWHFNGRYRIPAHTLVVIATLLTAACQSAPVGENAAISSSLTQAAMAAERTNDYSTAIDQYQKLLTRDPKNIDVLIGLARNLRYSGDSVNAVKILEKLGPTESAPVIYRLELAKSKIAAGKAKSAIRQLKLALSDEPDNWQIHSTLGIAQDLNEDFAGARRSYEQARALSEDNPAVLNNMALSAALSGDIDQAIALLEGAPRLARHSPQIRQNLAFFYGIKGDMKSASSLARMDLDEEQVRTNLAIYSRFHKKQF